MLHNPTEASRLRGIWNHVHASMCIDRRWLPCLRVSARAMCIIQRVGSLLSHGRFLRLKCICVFLLAVVDIFLMSFPRYHSLCHCQHTVGILRLSFEEANIGGTPCAVI